MILSEAQGQGRLAALTRRHVAATERDERVRDTLFRHQPSHERFWSVSPCEREAIALAYRRRERRRAVKMGRVIHLSMEMARATEAVRKLAGLLGGCLTRS